MQPLRRKISQIIVFYLSALCFYARSDCIFKMHTCHMLSSKIKTTEDWAEFATLSTLNPASSRKSLSGHDSNLPARREMIAFSGTQVPIQANRNFSRDVI